MTGNLDTTTKGSKYPRPNLKGLVYTLRSRARRRDLIQILKFHGDKIKHNKEKEHMRIDCPFVYEHPLEKLHGNKIYLNNAGQIIFFYFLSDKYYTKYSSVLCFNETKINDSRISNML